MQPLRLLPAVLAVLHWMLDGHLVLAKASGNGQNYGSFSSGLDQDGGLQPAVGGYSYWLFLTTLFPHENLSPLLLYK